MENAIQSPKVPGPASRLVQEALAGVFVGVVVKMVGEAVDYLKRRHLAQDVS